jgi:hypothetical protein
MSKFRKRAEQFLDDIQEKADGPHYAPCFRDCLGDARKWVEPLLAELLSNIAKEERSLSKP